MAKINFKEFKSFTDISHEQTQIIDIRKLLGNFIYTSANGIQAHDLAFRIYRSDGEVELDPSDVEMLERLAKTMTPVFMDSLNENMK